MVSEDCGNYENSENCENSALSAYETMARKSGAMLVAARNEDWDEVSRLERDCASIIEQLKTADLAGRLTPSQRDRKADLIRSILVEDAQIRDLAQPWLAELGRQIRATSTRREIDRAYS